MTLTVLTDDQIRSLLENLTASELEGFRNALASALHEYSTGVKGETSIHQPERLSVHSTQTGATTLFMPSANSAGNGIKVITLSSASNQSTATTTTTTTTKPVIRPTGAITLFTPAGQPLGLLHASTLTAFRTALASLCLVQKRTAPIGNLVVFGCGEQAYWHVRLALLARGADIKQVVFVNRRVSESCREVVRRFSEMAREAREREGWAGCEFGVLIRDREGDGYGEVLGKVLGEADVVVCCTPSTEALFEAGMLSGAPPGRGERSGKGRLVVAIGSYTPEMKEVPGELIRQAIRGGEREAGVVVVDTVDGALKEAGELMEVGVQPEQLVELGELVNLKDEGEGEGEGEDRITKGHNLAQWLQTGNVIYKSVGLGLMDLSIGMHIIEYAKEKEVGTHVEGF